MKVVRFLLAFIFLVFVDAARITTTNAAGQTYIEGRFTNIGGAKITTRLTTLQPGETAPNWSPTDTPTMTPEAVAPVGTIMAAGDYFSYAQENAQRIRVAQAQYLADHGGAGHVVAPALAACFFAGMLSFFSIYGFH